MNNSRRSLLLGGVTALVMLMSGCTTPAIEAGHHYDESVSSILISKDKQKIVFIGKDNHYIFNAPTDVVSTLELPFHNRVAGNLSNFHVDKNGAVTGLYSLKIEHPLSDKDRHDAIKAGYKPGAAGELALTGAISGTRYGKGNFDDHYATPEKLNKTHLINISYDPSGGEKAGEMLITPIIVSSEGVFMLYNSVLAPWLIPMAILRVSESCIPYCMTPGKK